MFALFEIIEDFMILKKKENIIGLGELGLINKIVKFKNEIYFFIKDNDLYDFFYKYKNKKIKL